MFSDKGAVRDESREVTATEHEGYRGERTRDGRSQIFYTEKGT
jgi:hypothetical protein